ncbi:uridine diphosphate glucose pyrophosphatase NUDT14-like [Thrips palmi]|uniref:Uridine diphosphate glucose pyrophosphatase NUDT14 n=1 Tax=Thrips palmi TaxID=161013 RepID=A0A6P9AC28_THRPL|nr:uridine diphosphate glucose pyrophosphatase NUDT14-like [Thrips palmi]
MAMQNLLIEDMTVSPLKESMFVRPLSLEFKMNGRRRKWDMIKVHDSVVIVIFNVTRQVLVFVKQFRPAIYFSSVPDQDKQNGKIDVSKYPPSLGITLEFCAGIVDKSKSLAETAKEEVLEECGYDVPVENLHKFKTARAGVSTEGTHQTFFYVEVTDSMKVNQGGGLVDEGEVIEVVEMSIPEVQAYAEDTDNMSPPGFLFGLLWFLKNKLPKC